MSPRSLLPRVKAANVQCPKHGTKFLAGPNKNGDIICVSCGWSTPHDHRVVMTPRLMKNVER